MASSSTPTKTRRRTRPSIAPSHTKRLTVMASNQLQDYRTTDYRTTTRCPVAVRLSCRPVVLSSCSPVVLPCPSYVLETSHCSAISPPATLVHCPFCSVLCVAQSAWPETGGLWPSPASRFAEFGGR